ncbi:MAG: MATE family efflux transporter [Eubacteriales bacterium]|nr:MATE family efflux transporter [Eubacteriales bacterium]
MPELNLFSSRQIRRLLIPLIFEQFMIVLVGLVDTMLLSRVSESALAAFSLVDNLNLLLMQVFMAVGAGGSIIAAQYIGKRDRQGAEGAANQTAIMVVSISLFIGAIAIIFNKGILSLVYPAVSPEIMGYARQYFLLCALSYPAYALYNGGIGLLYAQGLSKLSMATSVVMNVAKIALNYLFIVVLHMDVQGAGLSTIISRAIGAAMVVLFLRDIHIPIHFSRPFVIRFDRDIARRILTVALPSGLENVFFLTSKVVIAIIIAGYSSTMIAVNAAANTISTYISIPANAINLATITIVSQCVGAGRPQEAKDAARRLLLLTTASLVVMGLLVILLIDPIVGMLHLSPEATAITREIIIIYSCVSFVFWAPAFGLPNSLRAAGDNRFVMFAASFTVVFLRVAFSFILGTSLGLQVRGIWYAMYLDWIGRSILFIWRFRSDRWLKHHLV